MVPQHVTQPPEAQKNFLVVDAKTEDSTIEQAFANFTDKRKDIAIVLINQHVRGALLARCLLLLMAEPDRREDTSYGGYIYGGFPCGIGDTE